MVTKSEIIEHIKTHGLSTMYFVLTIAVFISWVLQLDGYNNLVSSFHNVTPILILAMLAIINLHNGE